MENKNNKPSELCDTCGDIGVEDFLMTCFNCREVREHTYCARVCLRSAPDIWLCQVCRSSARVLHISKRVDNNMKSLSPDCRVSRQEISSSSSSHVQEQKPMPVLHEKTSNDSSRLDLHCHGLMLLANTCLDEVERSSLVSNDTSPSKTQRPPFLAFPSPKRKRRTLRLQEKTKETNHQKPKSSYPCVNRRI